MNLPNKITLFRVFLIPVFLVVYMNTFLNGWNGGILATAVFLIASASDAVDGYIARKYDLITNFGKLMDPLADKMLNCAALVALTAYGLLPAWVSITIICREFIITGLRQLAQERGIVIASSFWAKVKTACQMVMILFLLINWPANDLNDVIKWILIVAALVFTVISAVEYLYKNRNIFTGYA